MADWQIPALYATGLALGVFLASVFCDDYDTRSQCYGMAMIWPFAVLAAFSVGLIAAAGLPFWAVSWLGSRARPAKADDEKGD